MTQYMLSVYQPEGATPPPPEALGKIMQDVGAWRSELQAAGAWVFTGRLHAPGTATVLQQSGGDVITTDGPFAEGKEYIAGFTIIETPDLDAALAWGRKFARVVALPLEVRPLLDDNGS